MQGHAKAQFNLAVMCENGLGVPKDERKAVEWYQKAANQEYADAQINLGTMYDRGHGIPKDDAKAFGWYQKAAIQGVSQAQFNLAVMYDTGRGVPAPWPHRHFCGRVRATGVSTSWHP